MENSLSLLLAGGDFSYIAYVLIMAIIGIVTLIRKVMEKTAAGPDGKKINLAQAVQEQINRYLKGGPPGRFGGRGIGEEDGREGAPAPPVRRAPPPMLEKQAPTRRGPSEPPRLPRKPVPPEVKRRNPRIGSSIQQSTGPEKVGRMRSRRSGGPTALGRKNLRKAVLLAEILGPPVSERDDYRLF